MLDKTTLSIFARLGSDNEHERAVSLDKLVQRLVMIGVKWSDLMLFRADAGTVDQELVETVRRLERRNDFLAEELEFYKSQVGRDIVLRREEEREFAPRFVELRRKCFQDDVPANWEAKMARWCRVDPDTIIAWKEGVIGVPESAFVRPTPPRRGAKPAKQAPVTASTEEAPVAASTEEKAPVAASATRSQKARSWNAADYEVALDLLLNKKKSTFHVARVLGKTDGQIKNRFYNAAPISRVPIAEAGLPMTYLEFWQIGFDLYRSGWRTRIAERFGIRKGSIGFNPPTYLRQQDQDQLRADWRRCYVSRRDQEA